MKTQFPQYRAFAFISESTQLSWLWLIIRLYVGWLWLEAGWVKFGDAAWTGEKAGTAVSGFLQHALTLTTGDHPAVLGWYGSFIQNVALPNAELFSYLVTYGEIAVGVALILGVAVGKAAFWGGAMNLAYMLAGSAGLNPLMFVLQVFLIVAWRTAGWFGLDRWAIPWVIKTFPSLQKIFM